MRAKLWVILLVLAGLASGCGGGAQAVPSPTAISASAAMSATMVAEMTKHAADIPTLTPTPEDVFFHDDFSSGDTGWAQANDNDFTLGYYAGGYRMSLMVANSSHWSFIGPSKNDMRVEADVKNLGGDGSRGVGLICRVGGDGNFYLGELRTDGSYGIYKHEENSWDTLYSGYSDLSEADFDNMHLGLDCAGEAISLYLNDELMGTAQDATFSAGQSGVYVSADDRASVDFSFDNFFVRIPPAEAFSPGVEAISADLELAGFSLDSGNLAFTSNDIFSIQTSDSSRQLFAPLDPLALLLSEGSQTFSDFILGVDMDWNPVAGAGACGIFFHGTQSTGGDRISVVFVRPSSSAAWTALQVVNNNPVALRDSQSSAALSTESGKADHLLVAVQNGMATLYANGELLGTFTFEPMIEPGSIGFEALQLKSPTTCAFSNMWVWELASE